ncbi:MAG: capsular biosynthesis protein [Pseudomonadota bacterium]
MTTRILMLQGPASWFPTYLGRALMERGAEVIRVCLCPGDRLFWRGGTRTIDYRGTPEEWADWLEAHAVAWGITDLVCLGDGRFWHRCAIDRLGPTGVRVHVFEQGYLRPHFLTIERDGTGGTSRFPEDWTRIKNIADRASHHPNYQTSFAKYAAMDVAYNLANLIFGRLTHPSYRTHALDGPLKEWVGWIAKAIKWPYRKHALRRTLERFSRHRGPVFVMALQLETDFQIRHHGPVGGVDAAMRGAIENFANYAPNSALLVVKPHPLDNGWAGWRGRVAKAAAANGVADRVIVMDGGALEPLFPRLTGLVTINSTSGLSALRANCAVKTLGTAIYDLPGLTHRGSLDSFWQTPVLPEPDKVNTFVRALLAANQVPGGFDGSGVQDGAAGIAERILGLRPLGVVQHNLQRLDRMDRGSFCPSHAAP